MNGTDLIKVDYSGGKPAVSARELHEFLEVKTSYLDWFPRMCEYGFVEGDDFRAFLSESTGGRVPCRNGTRRIGEGHNEKLKGATYERYSSI